MAGGMSPVPCLEVRRDGGHVREPGLDDTRRRRLRRCGCRDVPPHSGNYARRLLVLARSAGSHRPSRSPYKTPSAQAPVRNRCPVDDEQYVVPEKGHVRPMGAIRLFVAGHATATAISVFRRRVPLGLPDASDHGGAFFAERPHAPSRGTGPQRPVRHCGGGGRGVRFVGACCVDCPRTADGVALER
jgi:hypothetical protein